MYFFFTLMCTKMVYRGLFKLPFIEHVLYAGCAMSPPTIEEESIHSCRRIFLTSLKKSASHRREGNWILEDQHSLSNIYCCPILQMG